MDPKTGVFQAADGEDLVILACTVFDWYFIADIEKIFQA